MMNCWDVLGIEPTTELVVIRKAFARLLKENPPERDAARYQELRNAYKMATARDRDLSSGTQAATGQIEAERLKPIQTHDSENYQEQPIAAFHIKEEDTNLTNLDLKEIKRIQGSFETLTSFEFESEEEARLYRQTCIWEKTKKIIRGIIWLPALLGFIKWIVLFYDKPMYRLLTFLNLALGAILFILPLLIVQMTWPSIDYGPLMRKTPLTCIIVKHLYTVFIVLAFNIIFLTVIVLKTGISFSSSLINVSGVISMLLFSYERTRLGKEVIFAKNS